MHKIEIKIRAFSPFTVLILNGVVNTFRAVTLISIMFGHGFKIRAKTTHKRANPTAGFEFPI